MIKTILKRVALVSCALSLAPLAVAQERGTGAASVLVTYSSPAAKRPAFLQYLEREGLPQFDRWKADGIFKDYRVFVSSFSGSNTWDAMLVLDFAHYADMARWKEIDRNAPGGLSATGLALASPTGTYLADDIWHKEAPDRTPAKAVYFVIPYQYSSVGEYKAYAEAYVLPQYDGWMKERVLSAYTVYLSHHPAGKPWDALAVLEYRDIEGLAQRELVKNKVRAALANNPEWMKASQNKEGKRTEEEITIADLVRK
ncbi:MAG TPA: hypothetical protein VGK32_17095 [Vicinamibacterales bacterium]|jgi:hypothetical protein